MFSGASYIPSARVRRMKALPPATVQAYLQRHFWHARPSFSPHASIYVRGEAEILLPLTPLADYFTRIADLFDTLVRVEDREATEILAEMETLTPEDAVT